MTLPIGKKSKNKKKIQKFIPVRRNSLTGFTLIELIIAIGIILIFLTLSAMAFRRTYQNSLIKNATRELAHSLIYARDLAILEGVNYEVVFSPAEKKYRISAVPDLRFSRNKEIDVRKSVQYNYLPDKINFVRLKNQKLVFYPNGSSENFFVYLQDSKGTTYTVAVKGIYSQVRTFDYYYYD